MDRTQYLKMCCEISTLSERVLHIKQNVPDRLKVKYSGEVYYPYEFKFEFKNGKAINTAILHSLNSNSVIIVDLDKVELFEVTI